MIAGYAVPDFISEFWHFYIAGITIVSIIWVMWFLKGQTTRKLAPGEQAELMAPTWDGDLQELNNPLPRWWLYLFWFLIVFSIIYLVLYPGLGKFEGVWNWSSADQFKGEKDRLDAAFNKEFEPFRGQDIMAVAGDPKAKEMGQRLYLTYCSQCHGSGGQGSKDFPNLTDTQWLFGGDPDNVKNSIANGRLGAMPPMGDAVGGEAGAKEVANYVLSLGGKPHDAALAAAGREKYAACAACHGEAGKGMAEANFPNIVDDAWMYGGSESAIIESILKGRNGGMPAFQDKLGNDKIHLLAAYVWGMGGGQQPPAPEPAPVVEAPAADAAMTEMPPAAAPAQ